MLIQRVRKGRGVYFRKHSEGKRTGGFYSIKEVFSRECFVSSHVEHTGDVFLPAILPSEFFWEENLC